MKLPRLLRALLQRLHDRARWLVAWPPDASPAVETRSEPPATEAHRVIGRALERYCDTHADGDQPLLRVSWAAWCAITDEGRDVMVTDPSGKQEYAGCPVVVSYSSERPGIWCDALPSYVCGPHAGARAYGKGGLLDHDGAGRITEESQ